MKKPILLMATVVVAALGILGYTLLYAGSTSSDAVSQKDGTEHCDKMKAAHAGSSAEDAECSYAEKKSKEDCDWAKKHCSTKSKEECDKSKKSCEIH